VTRDPLNGNFTRVHAAGPALAAKGIEPATVGERRNHVLTIIIFICGVNEYTVPQIAAAARQTG
jgi:hypothetical protein